MPAIFFIAAIQLDCGPAYLSQYVGHCAAAVAAAPAVNQWFPVARLVQKIRIDVLADIARDQRSAHFFRLEGIDLLV